MKKMTAILLVCMLVMAGCSNSDSTGNKALDGDLDLKSNQSLVIAQVTAIYGNEITLALAEKASNGATNKNQTGDSQSEENQTNKNKTVSSQTGSNETTLKDNSQAQESSTELSAQDTSSGGNMPSEDMPSGGDMPSGDAPSGDMPSGDMPEGGNASKDTGNADTDKTDKSNNKMQMTRYVLTGEEMTATIPVGTPVTTLLGTVTTFSRIAVDNTLQIVTEKNDGGEDVIVAIYIVG